MATSFLGLNPTFNTGMDVYFLVSASRSSIAWRRY
jgi:hypothetical protein